MIKALNCSGRTTAQVIRHSIAKKIGILDSQVPRSLIYLGMHKSKMKVPRRPDLLERVKQSILSNQHLHMQLLMMPWLRFLGKIVGVA
ncbi:hypothetical protein AQUCO_06500036v1 [Aquilegia coerulea]|nr:hypothetical protein AQUCO_06500036v1 [Aquilegia coerulea]PIA28915.1 hypothetical protein AQUCO_06500036v1 [Aquilegia coerulea]PIA28916.1 hypothetical protein AQUCO_06500036v1 [Aquilegia coerulea]